MRDQKSSPHKNKTKRTYASKRMPTSRLVHRWPTESSVYHSQCAPDVATKRIYVVGCSSIALFAASYHSTYTAVPPSQCESFLPPSLFTLLVYQLLLNALEICLERRVLFRLCTLLHQGLCAPEALLLNLSSSPRLLQMP